MTIELIEETSIHNGVMFGVKTNGTARRWFCHRKDAEDFYNSIIADPSMLEPKINILQSQEIDVPSDK